MELVPPQSFNIHLTLKGQRVDWTVPPATTDNITRIGYLRPLDGRCGEGLIMNENDVYCRLGPVLGTNYRGELRYQITKQMLFNLQGTAILGYQRKQVVDPRLENPIANLWDIYVDNRIFSKAFYSNNKYLGELGEVISLELEDCEADRMFVNGLKDELIRNSNASNTLTVEGTL